MTAVMDQVTDLSFSLADMERGVVRAAGPDCCIDDLPSVWTFSGRSDWLIDGLVPQGAVTLLTGDSGVGKSTLALAMVGAAVHGVPFLERRTVQTPCLYVDGENPVSVVRERLERLGVIDKSTLKIWGGWNEPAPIGPHEQKVIRWAEKHQGLIVFDSLIQFHPGSEQDSSETRKYLNHYRHLAHQGAAVLLLHHTGKGENAKQYRGSSDIKAAVDQAFCLEGVGEADEGLRALRLQPFKCRIAETKLMRIDFTGGLFRPAENTTRTNREIVEQIVQCTPDRTGREIVGQAVAAGVAKNRAEALLSEGAREGWLIVTPGARRSSLYRLRGPDD